MVEFMQTILQPTQKCINISSFIKLALFSPQVHLRKLSNTSTMNVRTIVLFFTETFLIVG